MRKIIILSILAIATVCLAGCGDDKPKTSCQYGDDIPEQAFNPVFELSETLVNHVAKQEWEQIHAQGIEELKLRQSRDRFAFQSDIFIKMFGPIDYPRIREIYYISAGPSKEPVVSVPCNLGEPGVNDIYILPPDAEYAISVYNARTDLEEIRIVFQLQKTEQGWKLRSLNFFPITIKKRLYSYYLEEAAKYREKNMLHLASLYYKTAILLSEMGLNVNEFTALFIDEQLRQIKVDYMPTNQREFWTTPEGEMFSVYNVDSVYEKGKLFVHIMYLTEGLDDEKRLQEEARKLALFTDRKFPEYRQGFDGIHVTAASMREQESLKAFRTQFTYQQLDDMQDGPEKPGIPAPGTEKTGDTVGTP